jgi:hypothetical protein
MLVRVNFGWKAGRVEDIDPVAARLMLADGRATAVNYEPEAEQLQMAVLAQATTPAPNAAKASKRKA